MSCTLKPLRKCYDVYIGNNETKEKDFVSIRRDERIYMQVRHNLPEESYCLYRMTLCIEVYRIVT